MHSVFTATDGKTSKRGMYITKITTLSTNLREYVALRSISSLPFKDLILSAAAADSRSEDGVWEIPKPLMESLENNHNSSQLNAIHAGLSRQAFVLIQGPPGTGKTQTILGLLSAILHAIPARLEIKRGPCDLRLKTEMNIMNKYNYWKLACSWLYDINPRDQIMPIDGDDGYFPTICNDLNPKVVNSNRKYRVRVLVCAPSNSALDEIVLRVMRKGIRDENDHIYNPKIVRVGLEPHHSIRSVWMDHLVDKKQSEIDGSRGVDRDSIRAAVLNEAVIVFSTLSSSGSETFTKLNHGFDVVIIDEAAQAVEPATLIPLANGCKQVYLVGDPDQLPATVVSTTAQKFGYDMSLFERFKEANYPVHMLNTQYRMHPEIRSFPSKEFYGDKLEDGPYVKDQTERSWHEYRCFGPFCFFDIDGVESRPLGSCSYANQDEVDLVLLIYQKLATLYPDLKPSQTIGYADLGSSSEVAIITPYKSQLELFRSSFLQKFGVDSENFVDINTVDGFQGREKDIAIISCVRATEGKNIGFVEDPRRMNVGITRARSSILVVGSASTLKQSKHWCNLVKNAEDRKCLFKIEKPYASFFSDENMKTMDTKSKNDPIFWDQNMKIMETVATPMALKRCSQFITQGYGVGDDVDQDMANDDEFDCRNDV